VYRLVSSGCAASWCLAKFVFSGRCLPAAPETTWGASYQKQGPAQEWQNVSAEAKEVTDVEFDGNLELFIEKTIADRFVIRLAAQNLLDAEKVETQRVYESVEQLQTGTPVTTVGQVEESDPAYILTFRGTF